MQSSNAYADLYEGNQKNVSDLIGGYNPSELERQMLEKSNYNKPILDEIARAGEKVRQVNASYDWAENPALSGMGMGDRARLKALDVGGARQEGAAAGLMYTARQDDLASAITAWKDAFDAKYGAAKELSTGYQNLQGMAFGGERAAVEDTQWQKNLDQQMSIAQMQEAGANGRAALGDQKQTPGISDYIDKFTKFDGLGWEDSAKELTNLGYDISAGSQGDRLLRVAYLGAGNIGSWDPMARQWKKSL